MQMAVHTMKPLTFKLPQHWILPLLPLMLVALAIAMELQQFLQAGGDAPYTYSWSNGATGVFQFSLCPEDYSVSVTDASGCTADTAFTINEPEAMAIILTPRM